MMMAYPCTFVISVEQYRRLLAVDIVSHRTKEKAIHFNCCSRSGLKHVLPLMSPYASERAPNCFFFTSRRLRVLFHGFRARCRMGLVSTQMSPDLNDRAPKIFLLAASGSTLERQSSKKKVTPHTFQISFLRDTFFVRFAAHLAVNGQRLDRESFNILFLALLHFSAFFELDQRGTRKKKSPA